MTDERKQLLERRLEAYKQKKSIIDKQIKAIKDELQPKKTKKVKDEENQDSGM